MRRQGHATRPRVRTRSRTAARLAVLLTTAGLFLGGVSAVPASAAVHPNYCIHVPGGWLCF
ncbi:hypothetical protein [Streptomyces aidingensis]|uniref:Uncharacterized protein n=1 Tax=Streptomyces aidingensis TaxID=910347 RepID=A0A1I1P0Z2_9ACTN|nr:hypothetical protein [Streptomyces aidingensis]SFD01398.1 hypothetical protein SAMN05421773_108180 [Streptomyces aidingensis]